MRILAALALAVPLLSCGKADSTQKQTITIKGSDTMVILGQRWAEHYMKDHANVLVQITGGGSGTGIAALIDGATNICQASRPMKQAEKDKLKAKQSKEAVEISVAMDGLAIFVHESNPIKEISIEQLKAIYTGKVKNWADLGGDKDPIVAYSRENNSGTYMYFKEHVLNNEDFASDVQTHPGTGALINAVSKDKRSIGYGGIGYAKGVKALPVKKDAKTPAVEPTMANVVSGSYPISRYLYFYTGGQPEGAVRQFVAYCLGDEGQKICEQVGYYPLPADKRMKFDNAVGK